MNEASRVPTFMTIREAAKAGPVSEHHLRLMEKCGKLPGIRTGKTFRINYEMLIDHLNHESMAQLTENQAAGAAVV